MSSVMTSSWARPLPPANPSSRDQVSDPDVEDIENIIDELTALRNRQAFLQKKLEGMLTAREEGLKTKKQAMLTALEELEAENKRILEQNHEFRRTSGLIPVSQEKAIVGTHPLPEISQPPPRSSTLLAPGVVDKEPPSSSNAPIELASEDYGFFDIATPIYPRAEGEARLSREPEGLLSSEAASTAASKKQKKHKGIGYLR